MQIIVLTSVPQIAAMANQQLRRLGHPPVAFVAARRRRPTVGLDDLDGSTSVPGAPVLVAERPADVYGLVSARSPDLVLSWAFPWRVDGETLAAAPLGAINFHPSLLPRHRGPNPVGWTIRCGDPHYGVTWHRMTADYDAGRVLAQKAFPTSDRDTVEAVNLRMSSLGLKMLPSVLARLAKGEPGEAQDLSHVTHAPPFEDDYAQIDRTQTRLEIHTQVRAWAFAPGTGSVAGPFVEHDGRGLRILRTSLEPVDGAPRITCADGWLWLTQVEAPSVSRRDRRAG